MTDGPPGLPELAGEAQHVVVGGGELEIHFVRTKEWPALAARSALGDALAGRLWSAVKPVYERFLSGICYCAACSDGLSRSYTTAVAFGRDDKPKLSFPMCDGCSRSPAAARWHAAKVLACAASGNAPVVHARTVVRKAGGR